MDIFAVVWIRNYVWELLATERPKISVHEPQGVYAFFYIPVLKTLITVVSLWRI